MKGAAHDIGLKAYKGASGCRYTVHVDVGGKPGYPTETQPTCRPAPELNPGSQWWEAR